MQQAEQFHAEKKADCTLVLKPMKNISRYGVVETGRDHEITGFREKQFYSEGTINGGVYILNVPTFLGLGLPEKFSFEKDFLEKYIQRLRLFGFWQDSYFIDIGIPEDFERANLELLTLRKSNAALPAIGKDWTLFLDRDGVINEEVVGDYIRNWDEFHFRPGSLEAIALLTPFFQRTVIVTNQAGVGKGLMTMEELNHINQLMLRDIHSAGGHIDQVYFCTATDNKDINRKPNPGMALQAKAAFPEIDLNKSIMVGNMPNDMKFGRNFGAYTVYLPTRAEETPDPLTVDARYKDLLSFAKHFSSNA
jgi:D-glycero-alpha-D-manno-heptose 1-phosphate guanylyltransferase